MLKLLAAAASLGLVACGTSTETNSSQTCRTQHECVNGACTCKAGPKSGSSCCDPTRSGCGSSACDTFCRFCE